MLCSALRRCSPVIETAPESNHVCRCAEIRRARLLLAAKNVWITASRKIVVAMALNGSASIRASSTERRLSPGEEEYAVSGRGKVTSGTDSRIDLE